MPPKSKKRRQSIEAAAKGREALKQVRLEQDRSASATLPTIITPGTIENVSDESTLDQNEQQDPSHEQPGPSQEQPGPSQERTDPSISQDQPGTSETVDSLELMEEFVGSWVQGLDHEDKKSLAVLLCFVLVKELDFTQTRAAELAAKVIDKHDKTVRRWRTDLIANGGSFSESTQGRYQRTGVLWANEELNKKASEYVRANAAVEGKPNLTSIEFCKWVNKTLLPNSTLEPGFPRRISVETARKWLHEMGFEVLTAKKGIFVDGHERPDVVESRAKFLRKMVKLGFLHFTNAPTEQAARALPEDVEPPILERRDKTVVFFHDETTFQSNEDQTLQWGTKGTKMMKPKSRGAGIMLSDFIDERNGFLSLTDEEYERSKQANPSARKYARQFLEYGENKEGYWTRDKFMSQMNIAVDMAEFKYPKEDGWRIVWVFDHSSCHAAMADDALDASKMNVNPGGKQRKMRDSIWRGKVQSMNDRHGVPKGMRQVLRERHVDASGMTAEQMRAKLAEMEDFKFEKSMIEHLLIKRGHIPAFLPKFHPELNPIERVWAQLKRYTKAHCKYTIHSLRKNIPDSYDSVSLENIQNHFRKVKHFMFGYLEGLKPGQELDETLKKYKIAAKSHRKIGMNE